MASCVGRRAGSLSEAAATGAQTGTPQPPPPFNAAGAELQAGFDSLNDPAFSECADHGLIRQATSGHPMRITQYDDRVIFEQDARVRRVWMESCDPRADVLGRVEHVIRLAGRTD